MRTFLRSSVLGVLCLVMGWTLAGCSSSEENPGQAASGKMSGAMEKGKMEGGAMDTGKMEGGAMDKGKMDAAPWTKAKWKAAPWTRAKWTGPQSDNRTRLLGGWLSGRAASHRLTVGSVFRGAS